jgi:protein-tyrosine phosphatase
MSDTDGLKAPIANSYWLPGGRILAGEHPGAEDSKSTRRRLVALLDADITAFVDLTEKHELEPYDALLIEEAAARGISTRYARLPIRDMGICSTREMSVILDTIDIMVGGGERVYVHCRGGVGRTGTVVGCHLVAQGAMPDDALAEVTRLYSTMSSAKLNRHRGGSPETDAQRAMVRAWA